MDALDRPWWGFLATTNMKGDPRQICLDRRLDIFFRVFVLNVRDKAIWKEYYTAPGNYKIKRKEKSKKLRGLFELEVSIRQAGQKINVPLVLLDEKLYPADGASRISIMLYLQLPIKYTLITTDLTRVVTAKSPCFEALSRKTKEQFFSWKKQWEEEYYNGFKGKH